ncbi:MAG TPA: hypothetical protein VET84_02620 [Stellaceae bacterium]|nr:hypothetical protein [Stellaceae bacterium]
MPESQRRALEQGPRPPCGRRYPRRTGFHLAGEFAHVAKPLGRIAGDDAVHGETAYAIGTDGE